MYTFQSQATSVRSDNRGGGDWFRIRSDPPPPWIRHWPCVFVAFPNYFSPFLNLKPAVCFFNRAFVTAVLLSKPCPLRGVQEVMLHL